jgi:O-antigen ligase
MNKIVKYLIFALSFTPLIVDNSIYKGSISGKTFYIYLIIFLINIFFLINLFLNKEFLLNIVHKIKRFYKNPIIISVVAFLFMILLSSIFAIDKYHAFFGDIERSEGFMGIITISLIFFYSIILLAKNDWLCFFKLSQMVSIVLVVKSLIDFFAGVSRSGSFVGNPAFLSGYLIFPIFCSVYVFCASKDKFWKYFSVISLFLSITGIFLSQTRGTILGLFVATVVVLVFIIFKGKNVLWKRINLQKLSIAILVALFMFSVVFLATKKSNFWHNIPGISRVAEIGQSDSTTNTRLINIKSSLKSINPMENGLKKFVIGWGQDNFIIAYFKNFDLKQLNYEDAYYDRSHNKFLDVFVMNGILGLVSYLAIFFFLLLYIFTGEKFSYIKVALLFFTVAYAVHLFFLFDQVTTYIPFFIVLGFSVYLYGENETEDLKKHNLNIKKPMLIIPFIVCCIFWSYLFITNSLFSYIQMHRFNNLINGNFEKVIASPNSLFLPFTFVQTTIRRDFLKFIDFNYKKDDTHLNELIKIGFIRAEEYMDMHLLDLEFMSSLATSYTNIGNLSNDQEFIKNGEKYMRMLLSYSPDKPSFNLGMGLNLYNQQNYTEALGYFEKAFTDNPELYFEDKQSIEKIYLKMYINFYNQRDLLNFNKVASRIKAGGYSNTKMIDDISEFIKKNNRWPNVYFNYK